MEIKADLAVCPPIAEVELIQKILHHRRLWILDCIADTSEDGLFVQHYYNFHLSLAEASLEGVENQLRKDYATPPRQEDLDQRPDPQS